MINSTITITRTQQTATVNINEGFPNNTVAPALSPSGSQVTGTVITLGNGTWTGTSPITFEYRWTRDNVVIGGETTNTYTIVSGDDGTVIKGQVRATNSAGTSAWVTTSNQVDAVNDVFNPITTAYLTATGIPNDGTVYFASTAYEITGAEIWTLVDAFVVSGETDGWLPKVHAMWLYLGGTANSFKLNLVDPQDTNAAHRLQFFNTVSGDFGATGWTPNGTTSYALTYVKGTDFTNNSTTIGFYSRTNVAADVWDIGGQDGGVGFSMLTRRSSGLFNGDMYDTSRRVSGLIANSQGLFIETRRTSTDHEAYQNGFSIGTDTGTSTFDISTITTDVALGGINVLPGVLVVGFSTREQAMTFFASGFTADDVTNLTAANLALQTGLHRNV